ncbi:MAG TPA: hypothetical protein VHU80_05455 [Polyangiaceae bacterium]|nr:hypothetical protein [Polyangiaceae bacterium]
MLSLSAAASVALFACACARSAPANTPGAEARSATTPGTEARAASNAPVSSSTALVTPGGTVTSSARETSQDVSATPGTPHAPQKNTESSGAFPPASISPPFAKTASAGDGAWTPFGDAALGERAATGSFIVRTVLHPHPGSRYLTVTIAAIDLTRVAMRLVPGTEDMLWAKRPESEPSGLVPSEARDRLLAVMNGGFQPKHGHWGLVAGPVTIAPPRDEGCTLALYRDGSVRLGPWPALAASQPEMRDLRQTPPCLLDDGAVHPALLRGEDKRWAGHAADLETRRRSAVGLDASGRVLFYAMGEEAAPRWLADALRLAGARTAAELDINWYWTRFLLFGKPKGEPLQITSTLIPKMEHLKRGYVERPSTRDFFYFVER